MFAKMHFTLVPRVHGYPILYRERKIMLSNDIGTVEERPKRREPDLG